MKLTLWEPFRDLPVLHSSVNQLFDEALRSTLGSWGRGLPSNFWRPPVNIYETEEGVALEAEVPGYDLEDIEVEVEDGVLTIKGKRREEVDETKEGYKRIERLNGTFKRSFALPGSVDPERIQARLHNGILKVTLPKAPEAKRRTVSVDTA